MASDLPTVELIYHACLRAERHVEKMCEEALKTHRAGEMPYLVSTFCVLQTLRREIGRGLASADVGSASLPKETP